MCRIIANQRNFIRLDRIYNDYSLNDLQSLGLPAICDPADLNPPSQLACSQSGGDVLLSWTGNDTRQSGYEIHRSTDNITFTLLDTVTVTNYSDTVSGTYYYKIRVVGTKRISVNQNITVYSSFSNVCSQTI